MRYRDGHTAHGELDVKKLEADQDVDETVNAKTGKRTQVVRNGRGARRARLLRETQDRETLMRFDELTNPNRAQREEAVDAMLRRAAREVG